MLLSGAAFLAASAMPNGAFAADGAPAGAGAPDGPFTRSTVVDIARALAKQDYVPPRNDLPDPIKNLTYDQFRDIRFNRDMAIWTKENLPFRLELFHRGLYYKDEVDIATVSQGVARHLAFSPTLFNYGKLVPRPIPQDDIGFAGLRLLGHMNKPDVLDEVVVFLGASYFRSLGRGQQYGISARGLALKTGAPEGEEFPIFRAFWAETPNSDGDAVVIHALLDSPSVAGAYRFTIRPGFPTVMDVETTLIPRVALDKVGLAPGTSMFYFGPNDREDFDDWRPEVHDSDGLLMVTGRGERIWRPLVNPKSLQFSAFVDTSPRGFGLIQRNRDPKTYQDFESHYDHRPSLWVEPVGDWGQGGVVLVEIPSDSEVNDNMVAYWAPKEPIAAGSEFSFAYRLSWGGEPDQATVGATVAATRSGRGTLRGASPIRRFVIDYAMPPPDSQAEAQAQPAGTPAQQPAAVDPTAEVTASAGTVSEVNIERNPLINGWRLTFKLDPGSEKLIELRAVLKIDGGLPAETWLYRWTA
jgi:glucans biosynthesis protein